MCEMGALWQPGLFLAREQKLRWLPTQAPRQGDECLVIRRLFAFLDPHQCNTADTRRFGQFFLCKVSRLAQASYSLPECLASRRGDFLDPRSVCGVAVIPAEVPWQFDVI